MKLLGVELQRAGLPFMSAKAMHSREGTRAAEVVCATEADAAAVLTWSIVQCCPVDARVARAAEVVEWERWQE